MPNPAPVLQTRMASVRPCYLTHAARKLDDTKSSPLSEAVELAKRDPEWVPPHTLPADVDSTAKVLATEVLRVKPGHFDLGLFFNGFDAVDRVVTAYRS